MGGTTIEQPSQPSVTSSISDYVQNYPALFNLMQQYGPQEAAMQVNLAKQYAQPMGEAMKTAQEAMYPNETALSNTLTQQAQEGISSDLPDWAKASYMDTMRAQLGDNALAGSGADYMSRGLLEQQNNWKNYYQNLGLSITGRQPIATANTPQTNNVLAGYTPQGVMNYNASNYSTAGSIYGNQLQAQSQQNQGMMNMFGGALGGFGQGVGAAGSIGAFFSSKRLKRNIKTWA